jgi:7-cyano-7-deazaguanine synthase
MNATAAEERVSGERGPAERAVVLLSGGLDSSTALAMARAEGRECHCLTVRYGQRHAHELEAARRVAAALGAAGQRVVDVDLAAIGGSALTADIAVPKDRQAETTEIPITYVPARNTVLLSVALGWAEVLPAREIWLGVSAVDYSGYPDCRPEFVAAFQALADVATRAAVERGERVLLRAPLIELTKAETIRRGLALGLDYGLTHTCYDPHPDGAACGRCDACRLRLRAFAELGLRDPVRYA